MGRSRGIQDYTAYRKDRCLMKDMRVLIYGAGVIGSLYAALFSEAGIDVAVYARGERLHSLQTKGLLYRKNGQILSANVKVIAALRDDDRYDFVFLTVRENQLMTALKELKSNDSPTIVTMVNSLDTYAKIFFREKGDRMFTV